MGALRNPKLEIVARELAALKTPAQASAAAGYPVDAKSFEPNARKRAQRDDVKARRAEIEREGLDLLNISEGMILREIARIAFFDPRRCYEQGGQLKRIDELDNDVGPAVTYVKTRYGTRVEHEPKLAALRTLAEIKGMKADEDNRDPAYGDLPPGMNITAETVNIIAKFETMDEDERARRVHFVLDRMNRKAKALPAPAAVPEPANAA